MISEGSRIRIESGERKKVKKKLEVGYHFSSSGFHLEEVVKSFEAITQDLLPTPLCVSETGFYGEDGISKVIYPGVEWRFQQHDQKRR